MKRGINAKAQRKGCQQIDADNTDGEGEPTKSTKDTKEESPQIKQMKRMGR